MGKADPRPDRAVRSARADVLRKRALVGQRLRQTRQSASGVSRIQPRGRGRDDRRRRRTTNGRYVDHPQSAKDRSHGAERSPAGEILAAATGLAAPTTPAPSATDLGGRPDDEPGVPRAFASLAGSWFSARRPGRCALVHADRRDRECPLRRLFPRLTYRCGRGRLGTNVGHQNHGPRMLRMHGTTNDRTISVSSSRPMQTVEPTWPIVLRSLVSIASIVNASTKPDDVTTPPVLPRARIRPVFNPACVSSLTRAISRRL